MRPGAVVTLLFVLGCEPTAPADAGPGLDAGAGLDAASAFDAGAACAFDGGPSPDAGATGLDCCTDAVCAEVAMTCDPAACRCVPVACRADGPSCASLLPQVEGDRVCASVRGGTCFVRAESYRTAERDCPAGIPFCVDREEGCLCGLGCRPFFDDCEPGVQCQLDFGSPDAESTQVPGYCRGTSGRLAAGEPCDDSYTCAPRHLCRYLAGSSPVCVPLDCGLAEGAPSCEDGLTCLALDRAGMVGTCVTACDAWDLAPTCPIGERCAEGALRGLGGAICRPGADTPESLGEPCEWSCGPGLDCVGGRCLERCDPGATDRSATAACSGGEDCVDVPSWWRPVCAAPCDPFAPAETCGDHSHCAPTLDACGGVVGHCLPGDQGVEGGPCGEECSALGLVCSQGATARCRRLCATPGDPAGCRDGERCFSIPDPGASSRLLPYGFCARPCA